MTAKFLFMEIIRKFIGFFVVLRGLEFIRLRSGVGRSNVLIEFDEFIYIPAFEMKFVGTETESKNEFRLRVCELEDFSANSFRVDVDFHRNPNVSVGLDPLRHKQTEPIDFQMF